MRSALNYYMVNNLPVVLNVKGRALKGIIIKIKQADKYLTLLYECPSFKTYYDIPLNNIDFVEYNLRIKTK